MDAKEYRRLVAIGEMSRECLGEELKARELKDQSQRLIQAFQENRRQLNEKQKEAQRKDEALESMRSIATSLSKIATALGTHD